ncbi:hypothetical protein KCP78_23020 [Salmonella enterica subsp. enterica]|nr:hypothetical protein KCP78_23020 [Salmonella enterica subsp. enterica]
MKQRLQLIAGRRRIPSRSHSLAAPGSLANDIRRNDVRTAVVLLSGRLRTCWRRSGSPARPKLTAGSVQAPLRLYPADCNTLLALIWRTTGRV